MIARITETAVDIETLLTMLPGATWHYHPPSGDMDIVFAGSEGREAQVPWILVGNDILVRLDAEMGEPLSLVMPSFTVWLAHQERKPIPAADTPIDYPVARQRVTRTRQDLAGQART